MHKSLSRYIVYNAVLWALVLAGGVAGLYLLRGYGQAVNARFTAAQLVEEADRQHAQNGVFESEQTLLRALNAHPPIASDVVTQFRTRLIGMPGVMQALEERAGPETLTPYAKGVYAMLRGDRETARSCLREALQARRPPNEARLYLARLLLEGGSLAEARALFDAYWTDSAEERHALAAELTDPARRTPESLPHALRRLMYAGLWEEAFDILSDSPWTENAGSAERAFFQGLKAEANGDASKAQKLYETAREHNPRHRWARLRHSYLDGGSERGGKVRSAD
ncbi:MAG: hypothetical protein ACLFV4_00055 [Candidatus Hydrogenedentota bacterium]